MSYWTPDREEKLRKWWCEEGLSGGIIAERLGGGISRSAVLGKVHRMKLPTRAQQFQSQKITGKQRTAFGKPFIPAPKRNPHLNGHTGPLRPKLEPPQPPKMVKFEDLETRHCRWVEHQGLGVSHHCGHDVVPGSSWCAHHYRVVYRDQTAPRSPEVAPGTAFSFFSSHARGSVKEDA